MARLFSNAFDSYKVRTEHEKIIPKMIFIAYEGVVTEQKYFTLISDKIKSTPQSVVKIFPVERDKKDGKSHPQQIKDGIIEYYNEKIKSSFNKKVDSLWIVFDIDDHFKKNKDLTEKDVYSDFISDLYTEDGVVINAGISNPSFELWLILHFKTSDELDIPLIRENKKITKGKTYIKKILSDITLENGKRININDYFDKTKNAIENSKSPKLFNNNKDLFENVGTTVNKLLEEIMPNT